MTLLIDNKNPHPVRLRSFDGEAVMIPANAYGVPVDDKFDWHVPEKTKVRRVVEPKPVEPAPIVQEPKRAAVKDKE